MALARGSSQPQCNRAMDWNADLDKKFSKCCVCRLPVMSTGNVSGRSDRNMEPCFNVCGRMCAQLNTQTFCFVQGFILSKVLCTFLGLHDSITSSMKSEVKSPDTVHGQDKSLGCDDEFVSDLPVTFSPVSPNRDESPDIKRPRSDKVQKKYRVHASHKSRHQKRMGRQKTLSSINEDEPVEGTVEIETASTVCEDIETPDDLLATSDGNNGKSKVMCFECGKEFSHKGSLASHTRLKHKKDARTCRVCGKQCYGPAGLSIHMHKVHKDEMPVDCDLCDQKFSSSAERDRHLTLDHGKKHGMCHICGKYFKFSGALRSHILAHSGIRRFVCEICGKGFLRSNTLRDHKKFVHFCQGCVREYASCTCPDGPKKKVLVRPKKSAMRNCGRLQCYICYKTLENLQAYKAHMNAHRSESPYACEVCGKRFMHKAGLQTHAYQHKAKRFECDICKKTFTYKCNMESHREVHNEDKPYACEFCSKTFKTKTVLENHRRGHTHPRQYDCHICGKSLTKSHNLKRHLKVMHPNAEHTSD